MDIRGYSSNFHHEPSVDGEGGGRRKRTKDHQTVHAAAAPDQNTTIFASTNSTPHDQNLYRHHHHQLMDPEMINNKHTTNQDPNPGSNSGSDPDPDPDPEQGPGPPPTPRPRVRYKECLRNHAASTGGHVTDGCGEFMPDDVDDTPESLKCAACECHRSFHRKEIDGVSSQSHTTAAVNRYNLPPPNPSSHRSHQIQPPQRHHNQHHGLIPQYYSSPSAPMMMNFRGGGGGGGQAESSSEDLNLFHQSENHQTAGTGTGTGIGGETPGGFLVHNHHHHHHPPRKRHRTKFNGEQKEKMLEFAEKIGWRIQKQDEEEVQMFCADVNVKRRVFKVWMHNNKQAMKNRKQA